MPNFIHGLSKINNLSLERKVVILVILLVLFIGSFVGSVRLFRQKEIASQPPQIASYFPLNPVSKPTATLRLAPATASLKAGETVKVEIVLEQAPVDVLDIILTYDSQLLKISNLTQGESFPNYPIFKVEEDTVKITASIDLTNKTPPSLPATIASFSLTGKQAGSSAIIDFDYEDSIAAVDGENILGLTIGGVYTIK